MLVPKLLPGNQPQDIFYLSPLWGIRHEDIAQAINRLLPQLFTFSFSLFTFTQIPLSHSIILPFLPSFPPCQQTKLKLVSKFLPEGVASYGKSYHTT